MLEHASDVDNNEVLSVANLVVTSGDAVGVTVNADDTLTVDPSAYNDLAEGESEIIVYQYDVVDNAGDVVTQTATITIEGANDAPTVSQDVVVTATEDDAAFAVDLLAGATDVDAGAILSVDSLVLTSGDGAGVVINGNTIEIDPNAYNHLAVGESEVLTYEYSVVDEHGASVVQTATITITGENDGPVVSDNIVSIRVEEDTPI